MYKTYDIGEGVLRLPLELCGLKQPCFLGCAYRYMNLSMYYEIREDNLYYDTSYIIIIRTDGADRFYQISVYCYIEDPDTAAGNRLRQPRILDLYLDFEYKR
eukprot:SAG11_NODE_1766_length_4285_cov_2.424032_4_plen_102_part_00